MEVPGTVWVCRQLRLSAPLGRGCLTQRNSLRPGPLVTAEPHLPPQKARPTPTCREPPAGTSSGTSAGTAPRAPHTLERGLEQDARPPGRPQRPGTWLPRPRSPGAQQRLRRPQVWCLANVPSRPRSREARHRRTRSVHQKSGAGLGATAAAALKMLPLPRATGAHLATRPSHSPALTLDIGLWFRSEEQAAR